MNNKHLKRQLEKATRKIQQNSASDGLPTHTPRSGLKKTALLVAGLIAILFLAAHFVLNYDSRGTFVYQDGDCTFIPTDATVERWYLECKIQLKTISNDMLKRLEELKAKRDSTAVISRTASEEGEGELETLQEQFKNRYGYAFDGEPPYGKSWGWTRRVRHKKDTAVVEANNELDDVFYERMDNGK